MVVLDCTLRDGGYYNDWNFPLEVTNQYLNAMNTAGIDIVELGLRSLINTDFKGANAYTTDSYLRTLTIPVGLKVAVMVNAAELVGEIPQDEVLKKLFPRDSQESLVDVVRIACHTHEFSKALPACNWLKKRGFIVGFNLMQIAGRTQAEIECLSHEASHYSIDALYFADSMGSMNPAQTTQIIGWLRKHWQGAIGVHTHDNMGLALSNTLQAINDGATWLDATVTGMGRGPGNARTEELVIEIAEKRCQSINLVPLMNIIRSYFQPLKNQCGWGTNPYYYLSGKYGIHPTYIQEMLSDSRFSEEDILAAISHLKSEGGAKFSFNALDAARHLYQEEPRGNWAPAALMAGREVLVLGAGSGVSAHKSAIERFIGLYKPIVIALNTQSAVMQGLIDFRVACHPVRLLADCVAHTALPQPLITPVSALPADVLAALGDKALLDFGLMVKTATFRFSETNAVLPNSLVISYALALATSGKATRILLAGFDGYGADDPRTKEMQTVFELYKDASMLDVISITPTSYNVPTISVYAMQEVE
ncbi:aldolase catalytic domain-containing protein [Rheinheimera tilapiae]|jgi:4-hydroxy 2-oxovalerate aldolase|uniref:Aldolase catalytic domain-containing protein n=1 Tax=Rheinheimera tilapiae TaxID=875043 RepID=A0ABV6B8P2_9GAMM